MNCIRCGQPAHQYGTDGMPYCDSCLFYGMNSQCQKCGMYLPKLELQMYCGQWYCQYCIMDMREANKPSYEKEKQPTYTPIVKEEHCEQCGSVISSTLYIFNGKKLCSSCLEKEKSKQIDPISAQVMRVNLRKKEEPFYSQIVKPAGSFASGFFGWILSKFGIKIKSKKDVKKMEIVAMQKGLIKAKFEEYKPEKKELSKLNNNSDKKEKDKEKPEEEKPKKRKKYDWHEKKKD